MIKLDYLHNVSSENIYLNVEHCGGYVFGLGFFCSFGLGFFWFFG